MNPKNATMLGLVTECLFRIGPLDLHLSAHRFPAEKAAGALHTVLYESISVALDSIEAQPVLSRCRHPTAARESISMAVLLRCIIRHSFPR